MKKTIIALTIVMLTQSFSWAGIQFGTQSVVQSSFVQHQLYALQRLHGLIDQNIIYTVHDPYDIMIKMSLSQSDPHTAYWLFKIAKIIKKENRNTQIAFISILYHHSKKTNNSKRKEKFHTILKRSIKKTSKNEETHTGTKRENTIAVSKTKQKPAEKNNNSNQTSDNQEITEDTPATDQQSEKNFAELNDLINGLLGL